MNRHHIPRLTLSTPLLLALYASPGLAAEPLYSVTDLGPIGYVAQEYNNALAQVLRVNDNGLVAGSSAENDSQRAIVFEPGNGNYTVLPSPGLAAASSLNNLGTLVGWSVQSGSKLQATLWQKQNGSWQLQTLPLPNGYVQSRAWDINDSGVIVGSINDGSNDYAVYWPAADQAPVKIDGGFIGEALAINNVGQISGLKGLSGYNSHSEGFYWNGSSLTLLPQLSNEYGVGSTNWGGADLNESGTVVGGSGTLYAYYANNAYPVTHPFAWNSNNGIQDLHAGTGQTSWANSINDAGYVVGETTLPTAWNGKLWPEAGIQARGPFVYRQELDASNNVVWQEYYLLEQIPQTDKDIWHFYKASDNSNVGHIVGLGGKLINGLYQWHGYLLTPAVADLALSQVVINPTPSAKPTRKAGDRAPLETDTPLQLSLTVSNQGPLTAHQLTLQAQLDTGLQIDNISSNQASCSSSQDNSGNTLLQCQLDTLAVHNSVQISATFSAATEGNYLINTQVSAQELDSLNQGDNQRQLSIQVVQKAVTTPPPVEPLPEPQPESGTPPVSLPDPQTETQNKGDASGQDKQSSGGLSALTPWSAAAFALLPLLRLRRRSAR